TREPIRSQLPFAVNVAFSNAWIEFGDTLKAAVGWETAVISEEVVAANPSSSTTARRTVYSPGSVYRWVNARPSPPAPSPNVHSYRTIRPSESFDADASKTRGVPTFPNSRAVVKFAVGGMSTCRDAVV